MVKVKLNIPSVQDSFPEESAKRLTEKESKTEGTARGALTGPPEIEIIPEARTPQQRRVSARNFIQVLVNLINRIGEIFSRLKPSRFSGREQQPVEAKQEQLPQVIAQLPQISIEDIKEVNNLLESAIEEMKKFHFEPINATQSENEIERLENKDQDIKEIQRMIKEVFDLTETLRANDPLKETNAEVVLLKKNADSVLESLRSKLREVKEHYSALEAKYGDKTARFIEQLRNNNQFNAQFGTVVEILVSHNDTDKKLTEYVAAFSPIVKEFTGKAFPGIEEIQSVLEAGFQKLKESNPDKFNELKTIIENAKELTVVQVEGHPNVVLNLQLFTLQKMVSFVSEAV
jgi:hypothetical protein